MYPPLPLSFPNLIRNFLAPLSSTCYQLTHEPSWTAAGRFNYLILQLIPATSPTWVCGTDGPGRTRLPAVWPHKQAYTHTHARARAHTHSSLYNRTYAMCNRKWTGSELSQGSSVLLHSLWLWRCGMYFLICCNWCTVVYNQSLFLYD